MSTSLDVVPRFALHLRPRIARALVLPLLVGGAACLDDAPLAPADGTVRLAIRAQVGPGPGEHTVAIGVYYLRTNETRVDLPVTPAMVTVPRGVTTTRAVSVEITDCLADPDRFRESSTGCHLFVELRLLDANGEYLSEETQQVDASPAGGEVALEPFDLPRLAIGLSTTEAAFEAQEDDEGMPPAILIYASSTTGASLGDLDVSVTYAEEAPEWLSATIDDDGVMRLRPTRTDLVPGTYGATVLIESSREGVEPVTVAVTYTVRPLPRGGELVIFSDINVLDATSLADPNNRQFLRNLVDYAAVGPRGVQRGVQVECGFGNQATAQCSAIAAAMGRELAAIDYFAFVSTTIEGSLTVSTETKVLVLFQSCEPFSVSELNALKVFAGQGGRVVYLSDNSGFYPAACGEALNQLASAMRVGAAHVSTALDCGYTVLPASSLGEHQMTRGLTGLTVACTSELKLGQGAQPLVYDASGTRVVAAVGGMDLTPLTFPAIVLSWSAPAWPLSATSGAAASGITRQ